MKRLLVGVVLVFVLVPSTALAQGMLEEEYHKNIKVFQPKPFLKKNRADLAPFGVVQLNPKMIDHYGYGVVAGYHFNEAIWAGAQFTQFVPGNTDVKERLEGDYGLFPERSEMGYSATARFAWTPLFAKSAVWGLWLTHWDAFLFGGGGFVRTRLTDFAGAGEAGLGTRIFIGKTLALTLELSDMIYVETFPLKDETVVMQNYMLRVGLAVYVPFTFEYGGEK